MNPNPKPGRPAESSALDRDFVTVMIEKQLFGIPVLQVRDVLGPQRITRVPLSPQQIAGVLNLRGRIVTAINVRQCLNLPPYAGDRGGMSVVIEHHGELYSLMIDSVGEVLSLREDAFEANPPTLNPRWREVSNGIYRLEAELLVILDVDRLLATIRAVAA